MSRFRSAFLCGFICVLGCLWNPVKADASALRLDVSKKRSSGLKLQVKLTKNGSLTGVQLSLPRGQKALKYLWGINANVYRNRKILAIVPMKRTKKGKNLVLTMYVHPSLLKALRIVIRVGKHAPLAETMYFIDVHSYR